MSRSGTFRGKSYVRSSHLGQSGESLAALPYVLIVCEGKKTEFHYFRAMKEDFGITSLHVEHPKWGNDPMHLVERAQESYTAEEASGDPYDAVYCVFDKDKHTTYADAVAKIKRTEPQGIFHAITSVPCFEYWLLLHFKDTTRAFGSCNKVTKELTQQQDMSNYKKRSRDIYAKTHGRLATAKRNAAKSLKAAEKAKTDNPSTQVHKLVAFLEENKQN